MKKWFVSALVVILTPVFAGTTIAAPPTSRPNNDKHLTFMSRNLYLGADLTPVILAVGGGADPMALLLAAEATWQNVVTTDFPTRAKALAAEIAKAKPALVGLQEATLWRSQVPADGPASPATHVEYDFLELLLAELAKAGTPYQAVAVTVTSDVEIPRVASGPPFEDIRFTDRDVILARTDLATREMRVSNVQTGIFQTRIAITPDLSVLRGWGSVDVMFRGAKFRFVNSHLEAYADLVRLGQTLELLGGPLATALPAVAVGDFNSDGNLVFDPGAYTIMREAGFSDAWESAHPGDPGYTCCQEELLTNVVSLLTQRIDHVFFKGPLRVVGAEVSGEAQVDRIQSGTVLLWPSDHAGMTVTFDVAALVRR